jgi:hypothetical protein
MILKRIVQIFGNQKSDICRLMTPDNILAKIKLLLKLSASPNPHEAENARAMANKLIERHGITQEELESLKDKKPLYGDTEKVFTTIGLESWKQQIILAIGNHFECQIVQEEIIPLDGVHQFDYYAYGDPDQVENVKAAYSFIAGEVVKLVEKNCIGRGPIYIASYGEGVADAIKNTIHWDGIHIPKIRKAGKKSKEKIEGGDMVAVKKEREQPAASKVDVNAQSLVKDIRAFWRGVIDGGDVSLEGMLELEA